MTIGELTNDLEALVNYNFQDEAADYFEQIRIGEQEPWAPTGHIFLCIERLNEFLGHDPHRADVRERAIWLLNGTGWPSVAEDLADGVPRDTILERLREIHEEDSAAFDILEHAPEGIDG